MEANKKTYIRIGLIVMAIGFIYAMAAIVVPRALVTMTKAAPASVISISDSRVMAQKILALADGKDKCVVNVFILDKSGKGVPKKQVTMEGLEGITPEVGQTDADGKVAFSMTSKKEGTFALTTLIGGSPLPKEIKVTFRN
jgi:hypothetical protein